MAEMSLSIRRGGDHGRTRAVGPIAGFSGSHFVTKRTWWWWRGVTEGEMKGGGKAWRGGRVKQRQTGGQTANHQQTETLHLHPLSDFL